VDDLELFEKRGVLPSVGVARRGSHRRAKTMAERRLPRPAGGDIAALLKAVEAAERQAAAVHAECENAEANRDDVLRELNQVTEVVAAARQSLRSGKIREALLHKISEQKQLAQLQLDNTLREFAMLLDEDEQESRTK
jgi:hypothetical protein